MHLALAILPLAPLHAQIIVPSLGLLPCYPPSRTVAVLLNSRMKFLQMVQFRFSCQWMLLLHVVCFYAAFSFIYAFRLDSTFTTTFLGSIDLALTLCTLSRIFSHENIFFHVSIDWGFFCDSWACHFPVLLWSCSLFLSPAVTSAVSMFHPLPRSSLEVTVSKSLAGAQTKRPSCLTGW